ncbi:hypothetical protein H312_01875 [Anncaliia algerae PRA339]|uniref:Major facilitator superfamily associated domain-containing protein n=1 Tax=Anncaliia algerae PRA339 TaxID=1288291 RepID=A0A059F0S3_9MICR|nr:hypothetical protein H312_01875 [Anncaliia algerae PRA339]
MKYVLLGVFIGNFFTYAAIYSVHNYISQIIKSNTSLCNRHIALLNSYDVLKILSAYFFGMIGDKFRIRYLVCIFSLIFYVLTMHYITYYVNDSKLRFKTIFFDLLLKFFNTGIIPLIEVMTVNVAAYNPNIWCYSILRLSLVFGRTAGHLIPKYIEDSDVGRYLGLRYFAMCAVPVLLTLHFFTRDIEKKKEMEGGKETLKENLKAIIFSQYFLILLFMVFQGVHRTCTSSFQTIFTRQVSGKKNESNVYVFRTLPEVVADLACPLFEKRFGCLNLVYFGASLGILRALIYSFVTTDFFWLFYFAEIPKAFFSCFVCYGVTKLSKLYNPMERTATAQAFYSGMYNGLAPCITGIIGFFTLKDDTVGSLRTLFLVTAFIGVSGYVFSFFIKNKKF